MRLNFLILLAFATTCLVAKEPTYVDFETICQDPYCQEAVLRHDPLFIDDFLALHCLLRITKPASVFEIGTCTGEGTRIIKNAVGKAPVYSLELPFGQSSYDLQSIGYMCDLPFTQLIGDSSSFDYSTYYPIEAWFIDGAHDYEHVFYETKQALLSNPVLIVWHDADQTAVFDAIKDGMDESPYTLFRLEKTRIAFALLLTNELTSIFHD